MKKDITVVLLLLGRMESQCAQLHRAISQLKELKERAEVIVAADGPRWDSIPLIQMLSIEEGITVCGCVQDDSLPARVINTAMRHVQTDYVQLALLSDPFA